MSIERKKVKRIVEHNAFCSLTDYGGCTLGKLRDAVLEACGRFGEEAQVQEEDDKDMCLVITIERDETDDEQRRRLESESRWAKESETRERNEYLRLRAKFEPKTEVKS